MGINNIMRAREFTINVPITVSINGDEDPIVTTGKQGSEEDDTELQKNPVMVTPQQQELELAKAQAGKASPVIDKLTNTETIGEEPPAQDDILQRIKALISK